MTARWSTTKTKRPRVAALGLNESQLEAIRPYCGDLRPAHTVEAYLQRYSWSETDVVVASRPDRLEIDAGVHLITMGQVSLGFRHPIFDRPPPEFRELVRMDERNRERELSISLQCLPMYWDLAEQLVNELSAAELPPPTVVATDAGELLRQPLVVTSIDNPVALRLQWADRDWGERPAAAGVDTIALFLPEVSDLSQWFRAFLADISVFDPERVPEPPGRLGDLSAWYTPEESALAERLAEIERKMERLRDEHAQVEEELVRARNVADASVRRAIWNDGDELVAAVCGILEEIGFTVVEMDQGKQPNEAKHEDLRLTLADRPGWEAIVEIKGYGKGVKTNHARQVRMHRDHYQSERGREPDLTLWVVNPHREMDPSIRPDPDNNFEDTAQIVGAVCVLTTDLYQQWRLVKQGMRRSVDVAQQLIEAETGLWRPSPLSSSG